MQRREIGRYEISTTSGERVRAFVPAPLPPDPPLVLDGALQQAFESAALALGRLDGISALLPDQTLFLFSYIRKEAVLSSQIEGTQSHGTLLFHRILGDGMARRTRHCA